MNGHMGYSSCPFCLIAGERSKRTGDAMVFPHETVLLERTDEIYKRQIEDAVAVKQSVEDFVQRLPLGVDKLVYWKASLYRNFLLYFSLPTLNGLMKDVYFHHFVLFVDAISLLNGSSVSEIDILKADGLLQQFCEEFEKLYGVRNMTFNLHLLRHIPECVRRLGPLWAFNCFLFEDLNGRLAAMVHGTNHACLQVARSLTMAQRLPVLIESLSDGCAKIFCEKLLYKWKRQSINEYLQPGTFSVGKYNEAVSYPDLLKELLSNLYGFLPHFLTFHRLYHCKQLFVAKSYSRSSRVSSHVKYRLVSTNFGEILTFVRVAHQDVLKMFALVKKIDVVPFNDSGHAPHIMYCVPREDIELVPVSHLLAIFDT
ncbi:ADP,ATP carrier protein 1 [Frankliniella fusca]|uniref:ADP,ATP carrier protein 1 n=1 Tax=Frankliniella fusca TaxID=407009 RepID=A0AAE1HRQ9_9NEOP|nr:ADP,ATP carrier protein 1 [Frankliniella fusca]